MKNNTTRLWSRFNIIFFVMLLLVVSITSLSSCKVEDDIPPVSAYVEPDPTENNSNRIEAPTFNGTPVDFETATPKFEAFGKNNGEMTIDVIKNPVSEGINTSKKVIEVIQTPGVEGWAGFKFELAEKIDFSVNTTINIKVYSPYKDQKVLLKLEDKTDSSINKEISATTTIASKWEELSFNFSKGDHDKYDLAVLFFDFGGAKKEETVHYFDDIIVIEGVEVVALAEPTEPAPNPTLQDADVIAIFSQSYTDVTGTDFNPNWGQNTVVTTIDIQGNSTLKYENLNYQGIQIGSSTDVSSKTHLHIDYWTTDSTGLNGYLISTGPEEQAHAFNVPTTNGEWSSVDIPLTKFSDGGVVLTDIIQMKFDGNGTVYLDNIYFLVAAPTQPAPNPTQPQEAVYSLYSDHFTNNVAPSSWSQEWGQGVVEDFTIGENNVKKISDLNFQAITLSETLDLSNYTHIHFDAWTDKENMVGIKFQDFGADDSDEYPNVDDSEHEMSAPSTQDGNIWVGHDFALSDFTDLTGTANLGQIQILLGSTSEGSKGVVYIDNLYFYKGEENAGGIANNDVLIWSDGFNTDGAIDATKWFHQTKLPSGGGWYNGELQHYTDRQDNSYVSNGVLNIVAKKETFTNQGHTKQYTSARLNSKYAFKYGRVEVRAKLPTGVGTWPAIWTLAKNITEDGGYWAKNYGTTAWPACGEIDIMEHWGKDQNYVQSAMHTTSSHGNTTNKGGQTISTASSEFHVYELDWNSERMIFSVDGKPHYTYNPVTKNADTWPYNSEQYFLLNIAVEKDVDANFNQSSMQIDYVRVYQKENIFG